MAACTFPQSSATQATAMPCELPAELIYQIFSYLSPLDFDAARHTCKRWFLASLNKTLLESQLVNGGWKTAAERDLRDANEHSSRTSSAVVKALPSRPASDSHHGSSRVEWLLSKRLAAECRLCPQWKGAACCSSRGTVSQVVDRMISTRIVNLPSKTLSPKHHTRTFNGPTTATVSGCGKFALITQDRVLFVYRLQPFREGLQPLTSIFCHQPILRASMDTSSDRFAVAILLEGRSGVCCDLSMAQPNVRATNCMHGSMSLGDFRNFAVKTTSRPHTEIPNQESIDFDMSSPTRSPMSPEAAAYRRRGHPLGRTVGSSLDEDSSMKLSDSNCHRGYPEGFNPQFPNASFNRFFPQHVDNESGCKSFPQDHVADGHEPLTGAAIGIEFGPRRMYRNLCSVYDPPKSVAICPQRQCVAFGCSNGVELHWVDGLRGNSISRWFPLAAPSDFLYFLGSAENEQATSKCKLRLISSAAGPEDHVDADHYRAIPLSDGHVLFTDPESGHLQVGSDQPGASSKLRREIDCPPPIGHTAGERPACYSAGHDVSWGIRIIAAYGSSIMLYNLPPDHVQGLHSSQPELRAEASDGSIRSVKMHDRDDEPRRLEGVLIHTVTEGSVCDMAIDASHGGVKVWLFLQAADAEREWEQALDLVQ